MLIHATTWTLKTLCWMKDANHKGLHTVWLKTFIQNVQNGPIYGWVKWVKSLSCVQLFATPWTIAYQTPRSMGFSRHEYWSGNKRSNSHEPRKVPWHSVQRRLTSSLYPMFMSYDSVATQGFTSSCQWLNLIMKIHWLEPGCRPQTPIYLFSSS